MSNSNFVVSDKRDDEIRSKRGIESLFEVINEIHNSNSFQMILMLAEAESFCFADEATYEWRQHASGSAVRTAGAANEANLIRAALKNAIRSGASEAGDNRGMFGFVEPK